MIDCFSLIDENYHREAEKFRLKNYRDGFVNNNSETPWETV